MSNYIKFYDETNIVLRIILSALGVPAFLYRLFKVIIDKASKSEDLVFLILNVIPIIGTVIYVFDIVFCALKRPLPVNFASWTADYSKKAEENRKEENVVDAEVKDEENK